MVYWKSLFYMEKKKLILLFLSCIIFYLLFIWFNFEKTAEENYLYPEIDAEYTGIVSALKQFEQTEIDTQPTTENEALTNNLVKQQSLIGRQKLAILFDNPQPMIEASLELAQVRTEMYALKRYPALTNFFIPENKNELNKVFYQKMAQLNLPVYYQKNNLVILTISFLQAVSFIWFLFISLFTTDFLVKEVDHLSVTRGYPLPIGKRLAQKMAFYFSSLLILYIVFGVVFLLLSFLMPVGELAYPVPIYLFDYRTLPFWSYIMLNCAYQLLLLLLASVLGIIFNYVTKDSLVSFLLNGALVLVPLLFPQLQTYTWFLPLNYLDSAALLNHTSGQLSRPTPSILTGSLVLIIWLVLLFIGQNKLITSQSQGKVRG